MSIYVIVYAISINEGQKNVDSYNFQNLCPKYNVQSVYNYIGLNVHVYIYIYIYIYSAESPKVLNLYYGGAVTVPQHLRIAHLRKPQYDFLAR
jgi:hypothetical protein